MLCRHITIRSARETVNVLRHYADFERVTMHRRWRGALTIRGGSAPAGIPTEFVSLQN